MSLHDNADVVSCCRWFAVCSPRFSPRREQQFRHPPMPEVSLRTFGSAKIPEVSQLTRGGPYGVLSAAHLARLKFHNSRGDNCTPGGGDEPRAGLAP